MLTIKKNHPCTYFINRKQNKDIYLQWHLRKRYKKKDMTLIFIIKQKIN